MVVTKTGEKTVERVTETPTAVEVAAEADTNLEVAAMIEEASIEEVHPEATSKEMAATNNKKFGAAEVIEAGEVEEVEKEEETEGEEGVDTEVDKSMTMEALPTGAEAKELAPEEVVSVEAQEATNSSLTLDQRLRALQVAAHQCLERKTAAKAQWFTSLTSDSKSMSKT